MAQKLETIVPGNNDLDFGVEYVDVRRAAQILGVSASFLNKARVSSVGPSYAKFGNAVRYHVPKLQDWAESRFRRSTSQTEAA